MWFAFGLITFVASFLFFAQRRFKSQWQGLTGTYNNEEYVYDIRVQAGDTTDFLLGINSLDIIDLSIKRERWWDKTFKWLGISVEYQIGCDDLDKALYIITDNDAVGKLLGDSKVLQNNLKQILKICTDLNLIFFAIHLRNSRLWIQVEPKDQVNPPEFSVFYRKVIPKLSAISDVFCSQLSKDDIKLKDPILGKTILVLATSSGLTVVGISQIVLLTGFRIPYTVDFQKLFANSFVAGSIILSLLIFLTFLLLGRKARTHIVLLELVLIGYFGAISSSYASLRSINMAFDNSLGEQHIVKIVNKATKVKRKRLRRGGNRTYYYLYYYDWLSEKRKFLSVSKDIYTKRLIGSEIIFTQKSGKLGYRWIAKMDYID